MSVRICYDQENNVATLYDSCTGTAFGPVFEGEEAGHDANAFCDFWDTNAPHLSMRITTGPGGIVYTSDSERLQSIWSDWQASLNLKGVVR